jgi:predicted Fe-S protein YdhL (DUF1289 family)
MFKYSHITNDWTEDNIKNELNHCIKRTTKEMIVWRCMSFDSDKNAFLRSLRNKGKVKLNRLKTSTSTSLDKIILGFCSTYEFSTNILLKIHLPIGIPIIDVNECSLKYSYIIEHHEILDEILLLDPNITLTLIRIREGFTVDELKYRPYTRSGNWKLVDEPYENKHLYVIDVIASL